MANTGRWTKTGAGMYRRVGSDGITTLATAERYRGHWTFTVKPRGQAIYATHHTAHTLREAKASAEAIHASRVRELKL
jgi:hypothetical protein